MPSTPVEPFLGCSLKAWGLGKSGLFAHLETRIKQGIPRRDSAVAAGAFSALAGI
jgi:hypothetical protein